MKKISNIILMIFLSIIIISTVGFSQVTGNQKSLNEKINGMSEKLATKLLLSKDQKNSVKNILNDYFTEAGKIVNSSNAQQELNQLKVNAEKKIINLLDSKQKMKFEIIKDDWWDLANQ